MNTDARIDELYRARPRSRLVRVSMVAASMLTAYAWFGPELSLGDAFSGRRIANGLRFLGEIRPYPVQVSGEWNWIAVRDWAAELMTQGGWEALAATLAISVAAIVLAGALGSLASLCAARNLVEPEGILASPAPAGMLRRLFARVVVGATRSLLIFLRAVPEYVWAFLLIGVFGFTAWPAVLALALHNTGILGKLSAESIEDIDPSRARALAGLGASRGQIAAFAILPEVLPRFLLYFFYRWETCVREATVLGMLGVLSLGSLVRDARASNFYDELCFYIALGAALVIAGDIASASLRGWIRRAA